MKLSPSREWLDRFLSGLVPAEADLQRLVTDCPKEDQYLDYKSGKELTKKEAADTIREYVAAFANSDGGLLVVGYDERGRVFDDAAAPGSGSLHDWATRCLFNLAPYLIPPPRITQGTVGGHAVLVIATTRSPRLTPVVVKGEMVYSLRIGDSNAVAPPYLLSDLLLGRRNQPLFALRFSHGAVDARDEFLGNVLFQFVIENTSLTFADDVRCGMVTWSGQRSAPGILSGVLVADSLKKDVEIRTPPAYIPGELPVSWGLTHQRLTANAPPGARRPEPPLNIGPLDESPPLPMSQMALVLFPNSLGQARAPEPRDSPAFEQVKQARIHCRGLVRLQAAVYIVARNAERTWFQLSLDYDRRSLMEKREHLLTKQLSLERVVLERPIVAAEFIEPEGEQI